MTGLVALVGGCEHTAGCEPIDEHLLGRTRSAAPTVTVVPLASSVRTAARAVGTAVAWWQQLGATVHVMPPHGPDAVGAVHAADIIVLTGGVPDRLGRRLESRPYVWRAIVDRWRAGAHLTGSSSGAMILGRWRQEVRPPFGVVDGLGLVDGVAVAPHHELAVPRAVATLRSHTHPHITILGIDERTALVGRDRHFEVVGVGEVAVRRGAWQQRHCPGDRVELPATHHDAKPPVDRYDPGSVVVAMRARPPVGADGAPARR